MHPAAADLAKYLKVTGTDIDLTRDQDGGDCDFVATRDGKWIADVHVGRQGGCLDTMPEHVHVYDTRGGLFCLGDACTAFKVLTFLGA